MTPSRRLSTVSTDSSAPTAPIEWPSADFGAYTAACSQPATRMALASALSPIGVAVPCALTWSMSLGDKPASSSDRVIALPARTPSGAGATMWKASEVIPAPNNRASGLAPRALACSSVSMSMSAPASPNTKPSRSLSNVRDPHDDLAPCVGDCLRTRRTGRHRSDHPGAGPELQSHHRRGPIGHDHLNRERGHLAGPALVHQVVALHDPLGATQTRAHHNG